MARDPVLAANHARETAAQLVRTQVRQKAELAKIDAQHGDLLVAHLASRAKDGTVAAQHQREIGCLLAEVFGTAQVEDDNFTVFLQERQESFRFFADARPTSIAQHKDAHWWLIRIMSRWSRLLAISLRSSGTAR